MATTNSSADNRTMATDAVATIGMLIPETSGRDAIHLATEPVIAGERLYAGQHIGFLPDGTVGTAAAELLGIVDPFLTAPLFPGNRFWLVVYPRTITSLRHVWEHPSFASEPTAPAMPTDDKSVSERWLQKYADDIDETFNTLMSAADRFIATGEYFLGAEEHGYHGKFEGEGTHPDFWHHYQIYRGVVVPAEDQHSFFSCAC